MHTILVTGSKGQLKSEIKELPIKVNPIESAQYPTPAKRPFYSVLNKTNIKEKYMLEIPYWRESLSTCLNKI